MVSILHQLPFLGLESSTIAADDSWPRYAHDSGLTGRTTLQGDILSPRESWSVSLAGTDLEMELFPMAGQHAVDMASPLHQRTVSSVNTPLFDIDGSGTLRPMAESHQSRWARILPNVKGYQQVRWDKTRTTEKISRLELIAYDHGYLQPRTVWRSEPEDTVFSPLMVIYDIDRDGVQEICVAMHYRVLIFNGVTGQKETELRFHSSRSYGWFGVADVDGNGQMELVVLSDFQSHFDVLDYDPEKPEPDRLSVRWRRDIETNIEERKKWPQIGPHPVVDVTGDLRLEIVVNLYNDQGDGQWHTVVLDASSGQTIVDFPKRYTHGNADVDDNGKVEIFCTETDGILVPDYGRIEVVSIENIAMHQKPQMLWQQENASFGLSNLHHSDPTWATGAAQGLRHVLLTSGTPHPAFLVNQHVESTTVSARRFDHQSHINLLWSVELHSKFPESLAIENLGDSVSALLRVQLPAGFHETILGAQVKPIFVQRRPSASLPSAPIAVRSTREGPMHVFVEGAGENLFAIEPSAHTDRPPHILWQRSGRGIGTTSGTPVATDLDGDGSPELLVASRIATGAAELVAYHANGSIYWRHAFSQTPGARPVHNVGALSYWWPGNFRYADRVDLFVNTRRGLMHSDIGHLLDGHTGRRIWTQEKAWMPDQFQWGYTGVPVAVVDMMGDFRDELVNLYPVCFWVAEGATGELVVGRDLARKEVVPAWAAYGEPIVCDMTGDGSKEVLLDSPYILALLDSNGTPIWHGKRRRSYPTGQVDDNIGETTQTKHALLDFNGDRRLEVASAGYKDGVRAIDAQTGTLLWSLEAPTPTGRKCAAADIDGEDGDELIYVAGNSLIAVTGDLKSGHILWTWQAPSNLSLPAIADVDNDGLAEILVQSANGILHCIDGPKH